MSEDEKGKNFLYGIFVAIVGSFLVSSIIEFDNTVLENGSRLAIGFWSFMFTVSSIFFFQFTKRILKDYNVQKLEVLDTATLICVLLGIGGMVFAILH